MSSHAEIRRSLDRAAVMWLRAARVAEEYGRWGDARAARRHAARMEEARVLLGGHRGRKGRP